MIWKALEGEKSPGKIETPLEQQWQNSLHCKTIHNTNIEKKNKNKIKILILCVENK